MFIVNIWKSFNLDSNIKVPTRKTARLGSFVDNVFTNCIPHSVKGLQTGLSLANKLMLKFRFVTNSFVPVDTNLSRHFR